MKALDPMTIVLALLAAVVAAYLLVALVAMGACLWHAHRCEHVDWRYFLGEPLAALLGLLGGRALGTKERML